MSDLKSLLDVQVLGCERFHCLFCCQTQLCSGQQGREPDDGARIPETDTQVDVRSTSKGVSDFTDCFVVKRIMSEMTASLFQPDTSARRPDTATHEDVLHRSQGTSDFLDCFVVKCIMSNLTASLFQQGRQEDDGFVVKYIVSELAASLSQQSRHPDDGAKILNTETHSGVFGRLE